MVTSTPQRPGQIIDGSLNPDSIRPEIAYSIFFRMLTAGKTDLAQSHSKALAKSLGLNDQDIISLFTIAEEFRQKVSDFDSRVQSIKNQYHPNHDTPVTAEDRTALGNLQKKKDTLVLKLASLMPRRLSPDGWYKVHHYVQETIRRRTRIADDGEK